MNTEMIKKLNGLTESHEYFYDAVIEATMKNNRNLLSENNVDPESTKKCLLGLQEWRTRFFTLLYYCTMV